MNRRGFFNKAYGAILGAGAASQGKGRIDKIEQDVDCFRREVRDLKAMLEDFIRSSPNTFNIDFHPLDEGQAEFCLKAHESAWYVQEYCPICKESHWLTLDEAKIVQEWRSVKPGTTLAWPTVLYHRNPYQAKTNV